MTLRRGVGIQPATCGFHGLLGAWAALGVKYVDVIPAAGLVATEHPLGSKGGATSPGKVIVMMGTIKQSLSDRGSVKGTDSFPLHSQPEVNTVIVPTFRWGN